tara:strand:- start:448 stop:768 length:321 start_codon:yes stop_codon:yes gene_type:complete
MNKKLLFSLLGLFIGFLISLSANANYLSEWSNDDLCGWMESTSIPEYILVEVDKREILCYGGFEVSTLPESNSYEGINGTVFPSPDPSLIPEAIPEKNSNNSSYSY